MLAMAMLTRLAHLLLHDTITEGDAVTEVPTEVFDFDEGQRHGRDDSEKRPARPRDDAHQSKPN